MQEQNENCDLDIQKCFEVLGKMFVVGPEDKNHRSMTKIYQQKQIDGLSVALMAIKIAQPLFLLIILTLMIMQLQLLWSAEKALKPSPRSISMSSIG